MPRKATTMARYGGAGPSRKLMRRAANDKRRGMEDTDCRVPAKRARNHCRRPAQGRS
jgi:hypothetical protein